MVTEIMSSLGLKHQGKVVDTLIAHFDELNQNLKPGDVITPGTYIGTQGRTGSTTGAHISMDFFNPGSTSADAEVMKIKDLIRDNRERSSCFRIMVDGLATNIGAILAMNAQAATKGAAEGREQDYTSKQAGVLGSIDTLTGH